MHCLTSDRSQPTVRVGGARRSPGAPQHPQHLQSGRHQHQVDPRHRPGLPGRPPLPFLLLSGHWPSSSCGSSSSTPSSSSRTSSTSSLLACSLSESEEIHPQHCLHWGTPSQSPALHWSCSGHHLPTATTTTIIINNNHNHNDYHTKTNNTTHHLQIQHTSATLQTVSHTSQLLPQLRSVKADSMISEGTGNTYIPYIISRLRSSINLQTILRIEHQQTFLSLHWKFSTTSSQSEKPPAYQRLQEE